MQVALADYSNAMYAISRGQVPAQMLDEGDYPTAKKYEHHIR